jgi:hypothetical protein
MNWNDHQPDPPLSQEQAAVAASLGAELVASIDAALLSHATKRSRKVAMLVGLTMADDALQVPGLPDLDYAQRVKELVTRGLLVAEGNLDYMRYSEVRLP